MERELLAVWNLMNCLLTFESLKHSYAQLWLSANRNKSFTEKFSFCLHRKWKFVIGLVVLVLIFEVNIWDLASS